MPVQNSEVSIGQAVDERLIRQAEALKSVYGQMQELGVYPVSLIQGGKVVDLTREDLGAVHDRPFMVFKVAHPDPNIQTAIYKTRTEKDPRLSAINEIDFLRNVVPEIAQQFTPGLRRKIIFPRVYAARREYPSDSAPSSCPFCLMEYEEGQIAGTVHKVYDGILDETDLEAVISFIKVLQGIPIETYREMIPNLPIAESGELYNLRVRDLTTRKMALRGTLGDEYYERLGALLEEKKTFLSGGKQVFTAADINPSNMIKTSNGQLGMIDWERIRVRNCPSYDYAFLWLDLWNQPELQERFFQLIINANTDIPDFKEHFRLDIIFSRGTGELSHWWNELQKAQTTEQKEEAKVAIVQQERLVREAFNYEGVWKFKL